MCNKERQWIWRARRQGEPSSRMLLRSGSEESVVLFLLRTELACLREGSAARDSVRCKPLIHLEKQGQSFLLFT